MMKYIGQRGGTIHSENANKEYIQKSQLLLNEDIMTSCKLNLEKAASDNPRTKPFFNFFFSLVTRSLTLRNNLEIMLQANPFNFNKYIAQLLGNVLFISKSFMIDRFNIEKNIKLCASVIFYYREEVELVPVTLKDLGDLKKCNCPSTASLSSKNECSDCSTLEYQDEHIKELIRHLRIDLNANVLVDMINILLLLQKRKSEGILTIIEKLFVERFGEKNFESIKPTFDLLHFVIFNLVENYDYVKLTRIFVDFVKKSLKVDMNLTEILMLFMLKDNFIQSNHRGQIYDFLTTTSIYKRQICSSGPFQRERRMLVRYLSLSTSFLAGEPQVGEDLIGEITNDLNHKVGSLFQLPQELILLMIHYPLYFTQGSNIVALKIGKHAENSNIPPDLSGLLFHFSMIASGTVANKKDSEAFLAKSPSFSLIRERLDLSFKELFGIIYLMRADMHNDYFDQIITFILNKYSLLPLKKHVDSLLNLALSLDRTVLLKELHFFDKYCGQKQIYTQFIGSILLYFKRIAEDDTRLKSEMGTFYDMISGATNKEDRDGQAQLKDIFVECIISRNYSKFKTFKENMLYLARRKGSTKGKLDPELSSILDILDLLYELNFGTDIHDLLNRFKEFVPEFEINSLFNLCLKLLKTINGFKVANKEVISERMKESFNSLGEIMLGRPNDFEQLWVLIFGSDPSAKLASLNSFLEMTRGNTNTDDDRMKFHALFIDKKVRFLKNQQMFIQRFAKSTNHRPFKFGMFVIKRIFMRNFKTTSQEINLLLGSIATKLFEHSQQDNFDALNNQEFPEQVNIRMEDFKVTRFYSALMDFIVNEDSTQLATHFLEDHEEPMLQTLAFCRYCNNPNDIINRIFEQLMANNHHRLCAILYFYYIVEGLIQRRKITMSSTLEQCINDWVNIKPEFLEFIELYIDREPNTMVDMIVKIQNRVIFNKFSEKDLQKITPTLEKVMAKEFYENVETIIEGDQPNLTYLSELFKVPLRKMKFIYILATLKLHSKFDYVFEQFLSNQDVLGILETRGVNSQELVFLLKICLNEIDYDSITGLLKLIKLDHAIYPEVLIHLLLLDLKVEKKPLTSREFNKQFLVYSAIFDRLKDDKFKVDKNICWAFSRVLKGDFLLFADIIDLLNEEIVPQNHKYFSSIVTGMIGVKNCIYSDKRAEDALRIGGFPQYYQVMNSHFARFKGGERENSLEYAEYLLHNSKSGFKVHPFWGAMVDLLTDNTIDTPVSEKPQPTINPHEFKKLQFIPKCRLVHFIALYNLVNADETILEFIHDFALFRNIRNYLNQNMSKDITDSALETEMQEVLEFYETQVTRYQDIMRELIKDKKIVMDYASFARNQDPAFQGLLMGACEVEQPVMPEDFNVNMNQTLFQEWKEDLHNRQRKPKVTKEESEMCDRLIRKIEDLFHHNKKLLVDPFLMFVTHENVASKDYWDREFEDVRYLDDYLDSVINVFMNSLDQVAKSINLFRLAQSDDLQDYPVQVPTFQEDIDEEDSLDSSHELLGGQPQMTPRGVAESDIEGSEENLTVRWFGLPLFILLKRLRQYQTLNSYNKTDKFNEIIYKSNILFGVVEKALFFVSAGKSFRKYLYFSEFTFSIGVRMPSKSFVKYAGSLFMPEIYQWSLEINPLYPRSYMAKAVIIKEVFENDRTYFPNKGIFAQFAYNPRDPGGLTNDLINLATDKIDINQLSGIRKMQMRELDEELSRDYYTLQFLAQPQYKDLHDEQRAALIIKLSERGGQGKSGKDDNSRDPCFISIKLLVAKYYRLNVNGEMLAALCESYMSKKPQKEGEVPSFKIVSFKLYSKYLNFLNDLALGKYSVLSETKNIFTEQIELANHQKIYEAILHLHSCRRNFSAQVLKHSLQTLSPYLSSNLHNLYSVLEFVIEPSQGDLTNNSFYLFSELGLKNQSFFHLFLLHTYSSARRTIIIEHIIDDLGIPETSPIKSILYMLFNLCYLVKSDREAEFTKEQFTILAKGILGKNLPSEHDEEYMQGDGRDYGLVTSGYRKSKKTQYNMDSMDQDLIGLIYDRISSRKLPRKTKHKIEFFCQILEKMGIQNNSKFEYDRDLVVCFNNFILEITNTNRNKKNYLVKFEKNSKSIKNIFGAENSSLMIVFDIYHFLTYTKKFHMEEMDQNLNSFFNSPSFSESRNHLIPPQVENFRELLEFISAFYKADIEGILRFLAKHQMVEEYSFILSYYVYTGVLNNSLTQNDRSSDLNKQISMCLSFPLIQQIYAAIGLPGFGRQSNLTPDQLHLKQSFATLVNDIFNLNRESILSRIPPEDLKKNRMLTDREELQKQDNNLELLLSGKFFAPFDADIPPVFKKYLNFNNNQIIYKKIEKIKNLFFFKPEYYTDSDEAGKNTQAPDYIGSVFAMREHWNKMKTRFGSHSKEMFEKNKDLTANKIRAEAMDNSNFTFMNVGNEEKQQLVSCIYPSMIFVFIYLKSVRGTMDKNDNAARMVVMRQLLYFTWRMYNPTATSVSLPKMSALGPHHEKDLKKLVHKDPLEYLGFVEKDEKVQFLNRYSALLYNLKTKKSNLMMLKELLKFCKKFIFTQKDRKPSDSTKLEALVDSINLDNFMELYDYLEELENGRDIPENYKENIINLFIQIVTQYEKFKKHIPDIRNMAKLIQGDMAKLDYFVDKLFVRSDSVETKLT